MAKKAPPHAARVERDEVGKLVTREDVAACGKKAKAYAAAVEIDCVGCRDALTRALSSMPRAVVCDAIEAETLAPCTTEIALRLCDHVHAIDAADTTRTRCGAILGEVAVGVEDAAHVTCEECVAALDLVGTIAASIDGVGVDVDASGGARAFDAATMTLVEAPVPDGESLAETHARLQERVRDTERRYATVGIEAERWASILADPLVQRRLARYRLSAEDVESRVLGCEAAKDLVQLQADVRARRALAVEFEAVEADPVVERALKARDEARAALAKLEADHPLLLGPRA